MRTVPYTLGDLVEKMRGESRENVFSEAFLTKVGLQLIVGAENILDLDNDVLCVVMEGVAIFPLQLEEDGEGIAFEAIDEENIRLLEGEEKAAFFQKLLLFEDGLQYVKGYLE